MLTHTPSLDLVEFIETQILPQYAQFDKAHSLPHVTSVIRRSLQLARSTGADVNMVYAIAAYHDLGLQGPRAIHHITGGRILAQDARLRQWFTPDQLTIMRQAVEDHRASASHAPRSLYGRIVAEADRDLSPEVVLRRTVQYGLAHYPELSAEQQWQRFRQHLNAKYAPGGYIRLWLTGTTTEQQLRSLQAIIADEERLHSEFSRYFAEETGQA